MACIIFVMVPNQLRQFIDKCQLGASGAVLKDFIGVNSKDSSQLICNNL